MKKILLLFTVLAMLSFTACGLFEKPDDNGSNNDSSQDGVDLSKPLVWDANTDLYLITPEDVSWRGSFSDSFAEGTNGIQLIGHSDTKEKMEHELVIGPSERDISAKAYHMLERNMTEDEDAQGYLVYVEGGSVAIVYSNESARTEAFDMFIKNCLVPTLRVDDGPLYWDFYSLRVRAETNREKMYEKGFEALQAALERGITDAGVEDAATIAKRAVRELKSYYTLFKTEQLYWLSDLYDPETGGFYYSNSGRDNIGFLPDLESTGQAFMMLDRAGLFSVIGPTAAA